MFKQNPKSHEGPSARANTEAMYREGQARSRQQDAQKPCASADHPMSTADKTRKPDPPSANNECHDPK